MIRKSTESTELMMSKKFMNEYLILYLNSASKSSYTYWNLSNYWVKIDYKCHQIQDWLCRNFQLIILIILIIDVIDIEDIILLHRLLSLIQMPLNVDWIPSEPNLGIKCTEYSISFTLITANFIFHFSKYILLDVILTFLLISNNDINFNSSSSSLINCQHLKNNNIWATFHPLIISSPCWIEWMTSTASQRPFSTDAHLILLKIVLIDLNK